MKKLIFTPLLAFIGLSANAQTNQTNNFQNDYQKFLENQKTPLLSADDDGFILENTVWKRLFGEKEYYLAPTTTNVKEYVNRILNSKFHFISIEVSELSKTLLKDMSINIPDYVTQKVNVYLPEIDIDILTQKNISFSFLNNYGSQKFQGGQNPTPQATIFSENFETNPFPGSQFWLNKQNTDCGFGLVNCGIYVSSAWSIWCARSGASCNPACDDYVNNMQSYVGLYSIPISAYMNVVFKYWRNHCLNGGTADYSGRWSSFDGGTNWTLEGYIDGTDGNDCNGWIQGTTNVPPGSNYYAVQWLFFSDGSFTGGSGTGYGFWIDDLLLTGVVNGVDDITLNNSIQVTPNPNKGFFSVIQTDKIQKLNFSITNIIGEKVFETKTFSVSTQIDLSSQSNGIYFLKINSENGSTTKKIIINK